MIAFLRKIFISTGLILGLTGGVQAQSLQDVAARSKFVNVHFDYLKSKNARSVYAAKNPICPSVYGMSFASHAAEQARQAWKRETERSMRAVGFSNSAISSCVSSGGFIYQEYSLARHPKNKDYSGFMVPGILIWEKAGDYSTNTAPVFVQTHDYTGAQRFRLHDQNFNELCNIKVVQWNFDGSCKGFGRVSGRIIKDGDRFVTRWTSNTVKAAVFTNRTLNYVRRNF